MFISYGFKLVSVLILMLHPSLRSILFSGLDLTPHMTLLSHLMFRLSNILKDLLTYFTHSLEGLQVPSLWCHFLLYLISDYTKA